MQLHYCSRPRLDHACSQRLTKSWITAYKVLVSIVEKWSCQGLVSPARTSAWSGGANAQPESGTSIVVILHKTLNLTTHNGIAGVILAYGVFVRPRHHPSPHRKPTLSTQFKPEGTCAKSVMQLRRMPSDFLDHPDWYPISANNIALRTLPIQH